MGNQVTLIAELAGRAAGDADFAVRDVDIADQGSLSRLYFESYDPGVASETLQEAVDDIRSSFDGEYGELVRGASLVALGDATLVGALLTVRRPAWRGFPDCPLIIELFVARSHRRRGIGRGLVEMAMGSLAAMGEERVSLRVDVDNRPARELYESLGFVRWSPDGAP